MNEITNTLKLEKPLYFDVVTFSPLKVPFALKAGVSDQSDGYLALLSKINNLSPAVHVPALGAQKTDYELIDQDVRDICLFVWRDESYSDCDVLIHVYPSSIGIAEVRRKQSLGRDETLDKQNNDLLQNLEQEIQDFSEKVIAESYIRFCEFVDSIYTSITHLLLRPEKKLNRKSVSNKSNKPDVLWTARTLIFNKKQLAHKDAEVLIKSWLAKTMNPEDYLAILNKEKDYSMSWLNYVLVDDNNNFDHFRLDAMRLSQFFYAAQDRANQQLKSAISSAYVSDSLTVAQERLSRTRVSARLHLITYNDHLKYLTREKKAAVDEILKSWQFDELIQNGQRMVEVCSSKLEEANSKKRERSSLLTDLILVSLSFFAIVELALTLTEYSREVMSRPTLDFNDDNTSFFLSYIANVDTDIMFSTSVVVAIILFVIYHRIKIR